MEYYLKNGQTSMDIFYWIIDLANNKYKDAKVWCVFLGEFDDIEYSEKKQITIGLKNEMYDDRFYNYMAGERFDIIMRCANGNSIEYYIDETPNVLKVNGQEGFIDEVMKLEPPKHYFPKRPETNEEAFWKSFIFSTNSSFSYMNNIQKIQCCVKIAEKINATISISTEENGGRMTEISADTIPTKCEKLFDILIKNSEDNWILIDVVDKGIYTRKFNGTDLRNVILKDIINEE